MLNVFEFQKGKWKVKRLKCVSVYTNVDHKIRSKQVIIEHNLREYSYSYMFRPYGVIIKYICTKWELTYTLRYVYLF
jgi:hypothetical protein